MIEGALNVTQNRAVLVTGASGAGRSTATRALEDIGFEAIDNMPLSLVSRVFDGPTSMPPLALGIDVRNRDFSVDAMIGLLEDVAADSAIDAELLFLDCRSEVLLRRYSETRRRHPLAPSESPDIGIAREMELLIPIRERADHLIDTSDMTPHELKAEIERHFGRAGEGILALSVESFSYKRGLPRGVDMIFDTRFLANPHWEESLRARDGRDPDVAAYVALPGRIVAQVLGAQSLALGLNLGVAPSSVVLEPEALNWLTQTLGADAPDQTEARLRAVRPPNSVPETLLDALAGRLAHMGGIAAGAVLAEVEYDTGVKGHLLALIGAEERAEAALARAVNEALTFSGIEAGHLDVVFVPADAPLVERLVRVGIGFEIPQPMAPEAAVPVAPGSDPNKPPRLK